MRFKMTSKNPFRNFARNLRRITISDITAEEKDTLYHDLWCEISPKLSETERYLNSSPAYSSRCDHWNQSNSTLDSIVSVSNIKNPYLRLKHEFANSMAYESNELFVRSVSRSLMWFQVTPYKDDWVT